MFVRLGMLQVLKLEDGTHLTRVGHRAVAYAPAGDKSNVQLLSFMGQSVDDIRYTDIHALSTASLKL